MWVLSLDWEDPLEEEMATHCSILAGEYRGQRSLAAIVHGVAENRTQMSTHAAAVCKIESW